MNPRDVRPGVEAREDTPSPFWLSPRPFREPDWPPDDDGE